MRFLFAAVFCAAVSLGHLVQAQQSRVVVELFTSQGCSSCPKADEVLTKLSRRDDVIALSLHVDYWDYLGWRDEFASPAFTNRQRGYASAIHGKTVYTPQMVVQGMGHAIGHREDDVEALIHQFRNRAEPLEMEVVRTGNVVTVWARAISGSVGPSVVQLVRYVPRRVVKIRGGENEGREIVYSNIVHDWQPVLRWNGEGEVSARLTVKGPEPVVVLIQSDKFGSILAARELR